jgi:hypothetical protein
MSSAPEMSLESREDTGRPNLGLSLAALTTVRPGSVPSRVYSAASPGRVVYKSAGSNDKEELLDLRLIRRV